MNCCYNCDDEATHSFEWFDYDNNTGEIYLCTTCKEAFLLGQDHSDVTIKEIDGRSMTPSEYSYSQCCDPGQIMTE